MTMVNIVASHDQHHLVPCIMISAVASIIVSTIQSMWIPVLGTWWVNALFWQHLEKTVDHRSQLIFSQLKAGELDSIPTFTGDLAQVAKHQHLHHPCVVLDLIIDAWITHNFLSHCEHTIHQGPWSFLEQLVYFWGCPCFPDQVVGHLHGDTCILH